MSIYITTAKFDSKCAATGNPVKKGETIAYDKAAKKVYSSETEEYKKARELRDESSAEEKMIMAQEDAYFNNWYNQN